MRESRMKNSKVNLGDSLTLDCRVCVHPEPDEMNINWKFLRQKPPPSEKKEEKEKEKDKDKEKQEETVVPPKVDRTNNTGSNDTNITSSNLPSGAETTEAATTAIPSTMSPTTQSAPLPESTELPEGVEENNYTLYIANITHEHFGSYVCSYEGYNNSFTLTVSLRTKREPFIDFSNSKMIYIKHLYVCYEMQMLL